MGDSRKKKLGKSFLIIVMSIFLISIVFSSNVFAEENTAPTKLSYTFSFKKPSINPTSIIGEDFTRISIPGCIAIGPEIGCPNLPVDFVKLLIPPSMDISDISVNSEPIEILMDYIDLEQKPVVPYQRPVPFGDDPPDVLDFNDEIYNSNDIYPDEIMKNQGIGFCRGYKILNLALYPMDYNPGEAILRYYPEITVEIDLVDNNYGFNKFYRNSYEDESWVIELVNNPEIVQYYHTKSLPTFGYPGGLCDPADSYDYVIIVRDALSDFTSQNYNWSDLITAKQYQGLTATLVIAEDIYSCSDYYNSTTMFNDSQAKIREFCKDAYEDWGTQYVLIAGDHDNYVPDASIPRRLMDTSYEGNIETDIYWSNLDNNFNGDNDNDWGEAGDPGFDLFSEIFIGSIPCDSESDISNWLTKCFYYDNSFEKDYLNNSAFYGGDTGWSCQGDDFIDFTFYGTNNWLGPDPNHDGPWPSFLGFLWGFDTWNTTNPYQAWENAVRWTAEPPNPGWQGGSESAATTGLKNAINADEVTLLFGIAHADSGMSLDVYDSTWESSYHNTKPFFIHDYGCHCGDMSASNDGVLHSMLFHSDTELAFACVYNTCYGWGNFDCTNSSSALQQKLFVDFLFNTSKSGGTFNWQMGRAHAYTKDIMAPTINWDPSYGTWRAIIQGCLLFGDPAQLIKSPFQPDHGIAVMNLDVDDYIAHGETVNVEALIMNIGKNNESNILVNFTVNGTILSDTTISSLGVGQSELVSFPWNPDYGTYLVAIEATPVPGENITDNNQMNKTVHVIPAPDIWVNPAGFDFHVNAGDADSSILTIGNEAWAETSLSFNTSISSGSWCFVTPNTGTVPIDSSTDLSVAVDAASLIEGFYQTYIIISCNDLDEPVVYIPVILSVVFADDAGAVGVNCPIGQQLPGTYIVNATVENYGSEYNTFIVNCSIYEGVNISEDFEDDNGGYIGNGEWAWGNPTSGPNSAHSGTNCWATDLHGNYNHYANEWVDSIPIEIPSGVPAELGFWHWYDIEDGYSHWDGGNVKISVDGGASWSILGSYLNPYPIENCYSGNSGIPGEPCFSGLSGGWQYVTFDLSNFNGETVIFRWHFGSDTGVAYDGWYIDDVSINVQGTPLVLDVSPIYTSLEYVSLNPYERTYVEFSPPWDAYELGVYAINIMTELTGDEDISNDKTIGVVEIATAPAGHITLLEPDWNFVALPFNQSVIKDNLIVNVGGFDHSWSDAVTAGFVSDFILGWGRNTQSYTFASSMNPGHGYWIYAYQSCELKAPVFEINFDGYITNLMEDWNVVGHPNNQPCTKSDILVYYDGVDYNWLDACNNGYLSDYIFNWDSMTQSYSFGDTLEPGYAYWIYAYNQCMIHS